MKEIKDILRHRIKHVINHTLTQTKMKFGYTTIHIK